MIEIKQKASVLVPVRLATSAGAFITGVAVDSVSATVKKADGAETTLTLTAPDWQEATTGAFAGQGTYMLRLPSTVTDKVGALVYSVKSPTSTAYHGAVYVAAPYATFLGGGDTVAPIVWSVATPRRNQVRITFSEKVTMTAGADGALNITNYDIPGLTVLSAVSEGDRVVLLTTSNQVTGTTYTLAVRNITDLDGNTIT